MYVYIYILNDGNDGLQDSKLKKVSQNKAEAEQGFTHLST